MAEADEQLGVNAGLDLETPLGMSLLWKNDEHRVTGCITLRISLHPGYCYTSVGPIWTEKEGFATVFLEIWAMIPRRGARLDM